MLLTIKCLKQNVLQKKFCISRSGQTRQVNCFESCDILHKSGSPHSFLAVSWESSPLPSHSCQGATCYTCPKPPHGAATKNSMLKPRKRKREPFFASHS